MALRPRIAVPTRLIAAGQDEVIPLASTERLYTHFARGVATLQVISGVGHNTISGSPQYLERYGRGCEGGAGPGRRRMGCRSDEYRHQHMGGRHQGIECGLPQIGSLSERKLTGTLLCNSLPAALGDKHDVVFVLPRRVAQLSTCPLWFLSSVYSALTKGSLHDGHALKLLLPSRQSQGTPLEGSGGEPALPTGA